MSLNSKILTLNYNNFKNGNRINYNLQMFPKTTSSIPLNMPRDVYEAYKKDFQNGCVTVGNICSANCFFCLQKWNPPGVIKDLKRFLTMKEIKHFTNLYLNRIECISSAFHTNPGEFFLHPNAIEILYFLATRNKSLKNLGIFTNGMDLSVEHIKIIKKLNLYLYLSLNSADIITRRKIMGGSYFKNKNAIDSIYTLDKYDVNYHVWIVPLRSNLNNGDVESTIRYLKNSKVESIDIHRPGYTKYTPSHIAKELTIPDKELFEFILLMKKKHKVNIDIERLSAGSKFKDIFYRLRTLFKNTKNLHIKKKLFLCSKAVEDILPLVLIKMEMQNYKIKVVESKVFGGNVDCAGLLLVEDYICAIEEFLRQSQNRKPEVIILPRVSFDINMEDLSMTPVRKIQNRYKLKLILV